MCKRKYTHIQGMLPEIERMRGMGKSQREIAEHLGLQDKYVVKELLKRQRRKQAKVAAGLIPKAQGRPRKDTPRDVVADQAYEIYRLKMENKLLRDFVQSLGRK